MDTFPWLHLPQDLKLRILSQLPLDFVLQHQHLFPYSSPTNVNDRFSKLLPVRLDWVHSPIEIRNTPLYRSRASRMLCSPLSFVHLQRLVLGTSRLTIIPRAIGELKLLKVLHLDDNLLTHFPEEITQCENLLLIDCTHNRFRTFPPQLLQMPSLRHVIFAHNPLTSLPRGIATLPWLNTLSFYDCRLIQLPMDLIVKFASEEKFSLNIASNRFKRGYIRGLCETWPTLQRRLQYVMVEEANRA